MEYKEALEYLEIMRKFFTDDDVEGEVLKQTYDVAVKTVKKQMQIEDLFNGYDLNHLKELAEADKEGRCLLLPAGFEFKNGIYVLCEDISEVKEAKEGYTTKSDKAYFWIKTKEMNIFVSVANMPEDTLKYYEEQIEMYNKQSEGE